MNLYVRLLRVLLGGWFQSGADYADTTTGRFRVWLHDLDAFGHMNNGRYLQIMDFARTHLMVRSGVLGAIRRNRWVPLLGGGFIRYRFSLKMFQPYRVHPRLLCWDDRWFFLERVFTDRKDRHVAVGITRAALRKNGDWVATDDVVAQVHAGATSSDSCSKLTRRRDIPTMSRPTRRSCWHVTWSSSVRNTPTPRLSRRSLTIRSVVPTDF